MKEKEILIKNLIKYHNDTNKNVEIADIRNLRWDDPLAKEIRNHNYEYYDDNFVIYGCIHCYGGGYSSNYYFAEYICNLINFILNYKSIYYNNINEYAYKSHINSLEKFYCKACIKAEKDLFKRVKSDFNKDYISHYTNFETVKAAKNAFNEYPFEYIDDNYCYESEYEDWNSLFSFTDCLYYDIKKDITNFRGLLNV